MTELIPYDPQSLAATIKKVSTRRIKLDIPESGGPYTLNPINVAAYAIIKEALYDLSPRELGFLGQMGRAGYLSGKQRKWLRDLFERHMGYDFDDTIETV